MESLSIDLAIHIGETPRPLNYLRMSLLFRSLLEGRVWIPSTYLKNRTPSGILNFTQVWRPLRNQNHICKFQLEDGPQNVESGGKYDMLKTRFIN